jgi:hypothetical protein
MALEKHLFTRAVRLTKRGDLPILPERVTMPEIINHSMIVWNNMLYIPPKCNKMWGSEYILLDSSAFITGSAGLKYETIIDMFIKIRTAGGC